MWKVRVIRLRTAAQRSDLNMNFWLDPDSWMNLSGTKRCLRMVATYWNLRISCTADRKSRRLRTSASELKPTTSLVHWVTIGEYGCRLGRERWRSLALPSRPSSPALYTPASPSVLVRRRAGRAAPPAGCAGSWTDCRAQPVGSAVARVPRPAAARSPCGARRAGGRRWRGPHTA